MALNRRIVLEDSQVVSVAPTPEESVVPRRTPRKQTQAAADAIRYALGVEPENPRFNWQPPPPRVDQQMTFDEFFAAIGLNVAKGREAVACTGCHRAGAFDADFPSKRIQCLGCGRTTSFLQFKREHD